MKFLALGVLLAVLVSACSGGDSAPNASEAAAALGAGINIGNSLEAPREGDWGVGLEAEYFQIIAEAGFDHIRLPVSWAAYAEESAPYTIPRGVDPTISHPDYDNIWERVDWAIEQALANELKIVVNLHHYDDAHVDPSAHRDRIIAMWEQIAPHYADMPNDVYFELFNEPNGQFTEQPELWNELLADLLAVVRETNPTRTVLVGPVGFNKIDFLDDLELPDDPHLITTVHVYEPFSFTHQGAEWTDPVLPLGVPWQPDGFGVPSEMVDRSWDTRAITEDGVLRLDYARQWAGYSLDWQRPVRPITMTFEASGINSVRIGCRGAEEDDLEQQSVQLTPEPQTFVADLSNCPSDSTGFSIMNESEELEPVRISALEVCTEATGCSSMLAPAVDSLTQLIARAAEWSEANNVPIHIGEFGAFSGDLSGEGPVPIADRAAWTSALVSAAESHDLPFSYWEFHAGYAAYDLDSEAWVEEIRSSLLG